MGGNWNEHEGRGRKHNGYRDGTVLVFGTVNVYDIPMNYEIC